MGAMKGKSNWGDLGCLEEPAHNGGGFKRLRENRVSFQMKKQGITLGCQTISSLKQVYV